MTTTGRNHARGLALSRNFLCLEDVDLIQEAVRTLPNDRFVTVVDLGAGSGTTALSVFDERPEALLVLTVDHDPVAIDSTRECMTNAGYVHNWQALLGKTGTPNVLQPRHEDQYIDMLMVDAGHEYEDVKADLATWLPFVKDGAPVWMHDYNAEYLGCMRAIDEAIADGRLVPVKMQGWGVLCRKAEVQS